MNELISIIMPVYNVEKYIAFTIRSIIDQTYTNWELIIVDDHSTDSSYDIIQLFALKDKRIKFIKLEENYGAAKSRNLGIKMATGKYLAFLDSDDLWKKNKLEIQLNFMKKNNYSFTFTSYQLINEKGDLINKVVHVPKNIKYKKAMTNHIISIITVMINTEKIPDVIMPDIRHGQDTAAWLRILKRKEIAYGLDEILSFYRQVPSSISSSPIRRITRTWDIYRKAENFNIIKSFYLTALHFICVLNKRKGV